MNRIHVAIVVCCAVGGAAFAGVALGPTPYLGIGDSPLDLLGGGMSYVETFEDGLFNIPGVTASAGAVYGPASNADSVDEDDGEIDGSGTGGHSFFYSSGRAGIHFYFDADVLGQLPTQAGIVWTDGSGTISFAAYDANGNEIASIQGTHADSGSSGTTAEDRFYGVIHHAGIREILISNSSGGIEVDHLQFVVPGPSALAVLGVGGLAIRRRR